MDVFSRKVSNKAPIEIIFCKSIWCIDLYAYKLTTIDEVIWSILKGKNTQHKSMFDYGRSSSEQNLTISCQHKTTSVRKGKKKKTMGKKNRTLLIIQQDQPYK